MLFMRIIKTFRSPASEVTGKRILLYSYGGGCESGVFSMRFNLEKQCAKAEYEHMGEFAIILNWLR